MAQKRKRHSAEFKARVAIEALKGIKSANELASEFAIHPVQISQWKRQLQSGATDLFGNARARDERDQEAAQAKLYEEIGRLKMELDWLKKPPGTVEEQRQWIDPTHHQLSIRRQCELLGLTRSSWYYQPAQESEENLTLMRLIDAQYTRTPFYGSRRMTVALSEQGHAVNRKRVQRLMRCMGIEGVAPGPRTSKPQPEHEIYPYLLRDVAIVRPNQVWATDITYIPVRSGFLFLIAILDWYSRYVIAWALSNTLDTAFCLEALDQALSHTQPEIFNSDQGGQFTSKAFTGRLKERGVRISMDGRGRVFDNIFVERLWRTIKYELIYLSDYANGVELYRALAAYLHFYNDERPHQALDYRRPVQVYANGDPA